MLLAKQLFCTSDIRQNTSQYWFLHALMIISTQFFPYFCVFLLSPAASQPGVFSLMAVIIDELMIPEPAAVTPLLLGSLSGIIVRCRVAALLLEPVPLERHNLRACVVSHWLLWACRVGDHLPSVCFSCLLPECKSRGVKLSDFPSSFCVVEPQVTVLRWCLPLEQWLRQQYGLVFPASCVMA